MYHCLCCKLPQLREDGDIDIDSIEQEGEVYYECEAEEEVSEELDNRPGTQQKVASLTTHYCTCVY